jgi:predicted RNA binding protein YcfA (HicA-like mRNA interferase family)
MSDKLPVISGSKMIAILEHLSFVETSRSGSHVSFKKEAWPTLVTVPLHAELKRGTLRSIIRSAGITRDEFIRLCKEV